MSVRPIALWICLALSAAIPAALTGLPQASAQAMQMPDLQRAATAADQTIAACDPQEQDSAAFSAQFGARCAELGLPCRTVTGTRHEASYTWNLVQVDGAWYHCDLYRYAQSGTWALQGCLLIGDRDMHAAGADWERTAVPACPQSFWEDDALLAAQDLSSWPAPAEPAGIPVLVDGTYAISAPYLLDDSFYVRLRDLAAAMQHTRKHFGVRWDAAACSLTIIRGGLYRPFDLTLPQPAAQPRYDSTVSLFYNGRAMDTLPFALGDSYYFKLRDLAAMFDCGVWYDAAAETVQVNTRLGYYDVPQT